MVDPVVVAENLVQEPVRDVEQLIKEIMEVQVLEVVEVVPVVLVLQEQVHLELQVRLGQAE
jgi:hypothetical protein